MKLIRSGGTNGSLEKNDADYYRYGFGNYFMLQIKPELDELIEGGKRIALCVAAKPNKNHYDQRLVELGFNIEDFTLLGREDDAEWGLYDAVLMLGGETRALYSWLTKTRFSFDSLKRCVILGGDSAGAYVLSGKTLIDYTPDGKKYEITNGFLTDLNQLIAAHINNPRYHELGLSRVLNVWCSTNAVEYMELKENEIHILEI